MGTRDWSRVEYLLSETFDMNVIAIINLVFVLSWT